MKYLIMYFLSYFIFICNQKKDHDNKNAELVNEDKISSIILKDAPFLHVGLTMNALNKKEIYATLTIKNNSMDSIMLYKSLFPFDGKINNQVFSIFSANTYEDVKYNGPRVKYMMSTEKADEGTIIPDLSKENFFILYSGDTLLFQANIAQVYDFGKYTSGDEFKIIPTIENPYVSFNYKQIYEVDSIDGKKKPVYHHISFPYNKNIDSMRLNFRISGNK